MIELTTTREVIKTLGGNRPVAEIASSSAKAVSNWRGFEKFPSKTYVAMIAALNARGFTAPMALWGMNPPGREGTAA